MRRLAFLLLVCAAFVSSCSFGPYMLNVSETKVDERAKNIKIIAPPKTTEKKYSFLIITDAHFGSRVSSSLADDFLKKFKELNVSFIINLGDTLDSGKQGQGDDYQAMVEKMGSSARSLSDLLPHYAVIGNHDLYASDGWDVWSRNFYPHTSYYTFTLDGFAYYFLDTGNGTLGKPQLEDLERQFARDRSTPKIILMHYPVVSDTSFCLQNSLERNRLLSDFAKANVKMIFSGHYHPGDEHNYGSFSEVTIKSFGFYNTALLVTVNNETKSISYQRISF